MYLENTSSANTLSAPIICWRVKCAKWVCFFTLLSDAWERIVQRATPNNTAKPTIANSVNHPIAPCPRGIMMAAASKGPKAEPALPPTWKNDCAKPKRPPDAIRATREASGWKVEDPKPIIAEAINNQVKLLANTSMIRPANVNSMPVGSK